MTARTAAAFMLILMLAHSATAQSSEGEEPEHAPPPAWVLDLRRAEIIAAGSFPLTLLASRFVYSLIRFTVRSLQAGSIDLNYAPWFLAPPGAPELQTGEKLGIVAGAVSLSSIIAFIDFRLGRAESDGETE